MNEHITGQVVKSLDYCSICAYVDVGGIKWKSWRSFRYQIARLRAMLQASGNIALESDEKVQALVFVNADDL